MPTRKSYGSLPPVRSEASELMSSDTEVTDPGESPLAMRLFEVQTELTTLAERGEVEAVMRLIAARAEEMVGAAGAAVGTVEGGEILCRATTGTLTRAVGEKLRVHESLAGLAAMGQQVMRSDDTELDSRVDLNACRKLGARSLIVAPLMSGERVGGVLFVLSPKVGAFSVMQEQLVWFMARGGGPLLTLAETARVALERERALNTLKETLRRRDAELDGVLQAIEQPAWLVGEGGAMRANLAALEMLGVDSTQGLEGHSGALTERLKARMPETKKPVQQEEDPLARALTGMTWTRELLVNHGRGGVDMLVRTSAIPVRVDGKVVAAAVVHTDVGTQRKVGEQRDRYLALVEQAADCMAISTLTGRPVYLNPYGRRLLGFESLDEFRSSAVLETYLPADREAARLAFAVVREKGEWEGELRLRNRRTGEVIPVRHRLFTLVSRDTGWPVALGGVTRDLREQKRMDAVRERLVDIVGTDLRAAMAGVAIGAGSMLQRGGLSETDAKAAGRIHQSAERMGRAMGQVLDFMRTHLGGGLVMMRTPMDLDTVVQDAVAAAELEDPDRLVRYVKSGDARGLWDRERLEELLSTLVRHALRGSPAGRPVDVRLRGEREEVVLEVHRTGAPIPSEVLPQLFDAFRPSRADEVGREPEVLGLFIAREIARAHGGDVDVESNVVEGTLFRVRLPRGPSTVR
ncbi:MAG TPA: ATP-binding protein [Hyalangium sp.]|nr:ATP-binding protein [Hyalangium sp.]